MSPAVTEVGERSSAQSRRYTRWAGWISTRTVVVEIRVVRVRLAVMRSYPRSPSRMPRWPGWHRV